LTTARRPLDAGDRTIYTHNLWLNYLKPVSLGLVVSPNALRVAQVDLPLQSPEAQNALLDLTVAKAIPEDEDPDASVSTRILPDLRAFLTGFLGWKPDLLDLYRPGPNARMFAGQEKAHRSDDLPEPPEAIRHQLTQYDDTLEPSFAYRWPKAPEDGSPYALLGLAVPASLNLDRKPPDSDDGTWVESPQKKFERLLYETRIPIGLIFQDSSVRLVYRPESQQSGYITFPLEAILKPSGRLACTALKALLNHHRIHVLPGRQRLPQILAESRKFQNEVSTQLAEQVLAALFELIKGFEAADEESRGRLLAGIRDRADRTHEIYEGLLTVLMRLVFLLYAEERETFPSDDLFVRNYSIAGLFARLVEDEGRHPDTMDQRYGAWAHLISLFRLVYGGARYDGPDGKLVKVPARQGDLFDPSRFPFLEGQSLAGEPGGRHPLPQVADGTVLRVLRNLLYLGQERLSYRSLEVEQIGSVYEAVMGYRVESASGRAVAIKPEKRGGAPVTISLDELLGQSANNRVKWFKETTDRKLATAAASAVRGAKTEAELVASLDKLIDRRLTPAPVPKGSLVIQPSPERRRSGSHYTPPTLTGPIVTKALEPILARLGPNPTPEAILALKVCDPAMGSGAFLVEVMRQLARLLVEAWNRQGKMPRIPNDETPLLFASRLIAQRCLYGVDKNRMAVDLAKLSLWLATLARDHAFSFLDHNFRHGDSLVGLSLAQIQACHWSHDLTGAIHMKALERRVAEVMKRRHEILTADEWTDYRKLSELRISADGWLDQLRFLGAAILGVFFEGGTASAKERRREDLGITFREFLGERVDIPTREVLRREIGQAASVLDKVEPPVEPFHWEVEFPEVFLGVEKDGSLRRRPDGGFDAIVGNPPFMGGSKISGSMGAPYLDWLKIYHEGTHGNGDIVAHFFRRSFDMLRQGGALGLIATNTIGQGDTRSTGLRWICENGGTIYSARKRLKWPGEAAVVVSVVHVHKGELNQSLELDGHPVPFVSAYLFHAGGHVDPAILRANASKSFLGSKIYGQGFTFDDTVGGGKANPLSAMNDLIANDPRNAERILPYIGGEEVNENPASEHHRYVINFGQISLQEAELWPGLIQIVRERVKPERDRLREDTGPGAHGKKWWWQFQHPRQPLYAAINGMQRVLTISQVNSHVQFAFLPERMVFSHTLVIFQINSYSAFSILQSRIHEYWARFFSSSMKDDLRYTASDCFETFPFPEVWETSGELEAIGREYYEYRARLMIDSNKGLTKTYNRFHDPKERSPEIARLRELHSEMDRAVLASYRWTDVDTGCGFDLDWCEAEAADDASPDTIERLEAGRYFFESAAEAQSFAAELVGIGKGLPWRYRWRPEVRDDVLARLLLLNKQRAEAERIAGLAPLAAEGTDDEEEMIEEDGEEPDESED
jgi:N-6 DNA Methylase